MEPNRKESANPLKYAWPLPVSLLSSLAFGIPAATIPMSELFSYTFPLSFVLHFSVFAGLALSLKFPGKQRNQIPSWIFVSNAVLGFGRACWGAGLSARRGSGYAFYPGFRCAAPGAKFGAPLRG